MRNGKGSSEQGGSAPSCSPDFRGNLASVVTSSNTYAEVPRGFTYIGLLIAIAVMGVGLAAAGPVARTLQLREMEKELLFAGDQIRRAIGSYYEVSPGGFKQYPRKLEDLLRDNRYPGVQRYLRRLYPDPITGKKEWGLVEYPGVGITGVYSTSDLEPVRKKGFPVVYRQFEDSKKYSDWKFVYVPGQGQGRPAQQVPAQQIPAQQVPAPAQPVPLQPVPLQPGPVPPPR